MPINKTLPGLLDEMAQRFPNRELAVFGEQRLTYAAFREQARQLAKGLLRLGLAPGDKVGLLMPNRMEWLLVDFAVMMLGGTLVAINTWYRTHELRHVLGHSEVSTLITVDKFLKQDYLAMLHEIGVGTERFPLLRRVVCLGDVEASGLTPFSTLWELGGDVTDTELDARQRAVSPEDIAYILFTSGSTSMPKGVPLQHFGLIENMYNIGERLHLTERDRMWMGISLFWGLGCENALMALMTHGGCVVLQHHFDAEEALALIERERCTIYYGTPNMAFALAADPSRPRRDLSSLRTGVAIGTRQAMQTVVDLGVHQICQCYGLTESYGNCSITDAEDPLEVRLTTVGKPLPGNEVIISDPKTHAPLPSGKIGEIKIRGYMMPGYYRDEERNAESFDGEGFFLSGDLGFYDPDGNLHFHGRIKEMVKTGGINVAPAEIEHFLAELPGVQEAFIIGLPDPIRDEVVAAVVVREEGATVTAEELTEQCRAAMAQYKVPRRIEFMEKDQLPLTASGKVRKHILREMLTKTS
ncbi:MAG: AMP-binding protein [bacterium]